MYHQFKQLADLDITNEPMEVGPTTHYVMGGVRVDGDTQMSNVPGLFAARRMRGRASTAPTASAATRSPICSSSANAPANTRRSSRRRIRRRRSTTDEVDRDAAARRSRRSTAAPQAKNPFQIQYDLQDMMQDLVGIVRTRRRDAAGARTASTSSESARAQVGTCRQPRIQPRLAHRPRPAQSADGLRSHHPLRDRAQGKPRRAFPRRLSRERSRSSRSSTSIIPQGRGRRDADSAASPIPPKCRTELKARSIEEIEVSSRWRKQRRLTAVRYARRRSNLARRRRTASSSTTRPRSPRAWSCSTPCTRSRPTQANDLACRWNCKAGKCGSCSAEINGKPKLMCMTRLNELDLDAAGHRRADASVPADPGSGDGCLVELPSQEEDQEVQAAQARRAGRHLADGAGRRRPRAGIPQVHRVLPVPGRVPRAARPPQARGVHRPALLRLHGRAGDAPARHRRPRCRS